MTVFNVHQLHKEPWIWMVEDFLSAEECDYVIDLTKDHLKLGTLYNPESKDLTGYTNKEVRSSKVAFIPMHFTPTIKVIEERICEFVNIPINYGEKLQVVKYETGESFDKHFDLFDPNTKNVKDYIARFGQRITTVIMYLNNVEEGGYTFFPQIGLEIWPVKGTALLFHSVDPATGQLERMTVHEGQKVTKGEKWIVTKWFRDLPFHDITYGMIPQNVIT